MVRTSRVGKSRKLNKSRVKRISKSLKAGTVRPLSPRYEVVDLFLEEQLERQMMRNLRRIQYEERIAYLKEIINKASEDAKGYQRLITLNLNTLSRVKAGEYNSGYLYQVDDETAREYEIIRYTGYVNDYQIELIKQLQIILDSENEIAHLEELLRNN